MAHQPPQLNIWQHATARLQAAQGVAVDAVLGEPMQVEPQAPTPIVAAAPVPLSPADSDSMVPLTQPSIASEAPQTSVPDEQSQQSESSGHDAESAPLTPLVRSKKRKAG